MNALGQDTMDGKRKPLRVVAAALGLATFTIVLWGLLPAETDDLDRVFCASFALALAIFLVTLWGRVGLGFLVAGALAGCVWLAGSLKLAYLHEPLMGPDLRYFLDATTLDVIAHYPAMWHKCAAALAGALALAVLVWRLESPGWWRGRALWRRGAFSLLALLPLAFTAWPQGPFRGVYDVRTWDFIDHAKLNPTTAFLSSLSRMHVTIPAYTLAAAAHYDWGSATIAAPTAPTRYPNLVTVIEESTLNPHQWAICNVPRCTFPMFQPDPDTNATGPLRVHTYGGATWTSEFAFFAGMPHTLFGPAGVYAPYNLVPRMRESLPRQLKALGYRTIAIYPMPRDFVRAGNAYADYGFDEFYDATDLHLAWESTDADVVHSFEEVQRRERAKDDRPLFFMILTMHQHGPHDHPLDALPPPWNQSPLPALDARINRNLGTYLFRLHESDGAIAELRRFLFADGKPTVLVHFGDHHPSFDGLEMKLPSGLPQELHSEAWEVTYYRIDSNFDRAPFPHYAVLDLAYLAGLLLDVAELPKDAYFEANTRLRERCEGRFVDCPSPAVMDSYLAHVFGQLHAFAE
jgi:phosphoglycerol transferase MdoB-like AlkP superfamily enzyme